MICSSFVFALVALVAPAFAQQGAPPQQQPRPPQSKKAPVPEIPKDTEIVTTKSGLKYCVLTPGTGTEHPKLDDKVKVNYTGWNVDGSVFDSSRPTGSPAEFLVGQMVPGWVEALELMTTGAHWKLTLPPELGYGEAGRPPVIKPNATLIFELELVDFAPGPPLPPFHPGDPKKQQSNESGLKWETLVEGTGPTPKPDDLLEINFAFWHSDGRLIGCSEVEGHSTIGRASMFQLRFLQIAPQYMKEGERARFVVPAELCEGLKPPPAPGSTIIWELELKKVTEVKLPPFVAPDPAKQQKTKSGLLYEVLKEGTGAQAKAGGIAFARHIGWLKDGKMFDESYSLPDPMRFPLQPNRLIKGWLEGIPLMREGSIYRFEIPPDLAYGARGRPPVIPPDATLIFQVELVKVGS